MEANGKSYKHWRLFLGIFYIVFTYLKCNINQGLATGLSRLTKLIKSLTLHIVSQLSIADCLMGSNTGTFSLHTVVYTHTAIVIKSTSVGGGFI